MAEKDALMAMFSDETNDDNETVHNENSSDEVSAESVETSQENGTNGTLENKSSGVSAVSDDQTLAGVLPAGGINLKDVLSELEVNLIRQASGIGQTERCYIKSCRNAGNAQNYFGGKNEKVWDRGKRFLDF